MTISWPFLPSPIPRGLRYYLLRSQARATGKVLCVWPKVLLGRYVYTYSLEEPRTAEDYVTVMGTRQEYWEDPIYYERVHTALGACLERAGNWLKIPLKVGGETVGYDVNWNKTVIVQSPLSLYYTIRSEQAIKEHKEDESRPYRIIEVPLIVYMDGKEYEFVNVWVDANNRQVFRGDGLLFSMDPLTLDSQYGMVPPYFAVYEGS